MAWIVKRLVVEAWAKLGIQTKEVTPFRVRSEAPAGASVPSAKTNLCPLLTGGFNASRNSELGRMTALVSNPEDDGGWPTVTRKERTKILLVVCPSSTVTVTTAEPKALVPGA